MIQPQYIDSKDRKIVEILKNDSRTHQQKIAEEIGLSRPAVQKRLKALEEKKIILRYTVITDERKLGKEITAYIMVKLDRSRRAWDFTYQELLNRMEELELLEIHHVTGDHDIILKMKTRNIESLEFNLIKITEITGVARTRTFIGLSSVEYGFPIPESSLITYNRSLSLDSIY